MRRYLEGIEAGDDSAVLHMAAPRRVGELTLGVRARAGASLKLATHFQGQPFSVASHGHADGHRSRSPTPRRMGGKKKSGLSRAEVTKSDVRKSPVKKMQETEAEVFLFFPPPSLQMGGESFGLCCRWFLGKSAAEVSLR